MLSTAPALTIVPAIAALASRLIAAVRRPGSRLTDAPQHFTADVVFAAAASTSAEVLDGESGREDRS